MKKLVTLSVALLFVLISMAGMANADEIKLTVSGNITIRDFNYLCQGATVVGTVPFNQDLVSGPILKSGGKLFAKTNGGGRYQFDKHNVTYDPTIAFPIHIRVDWQLIMFDIVQIDFEADEDGDLQNPVGFNSYIIDDLDAELVAWNAQII